MGSCFRGKRGGELLGGVLGKGGGGGGESSLGRGKGGSWGGGGECKVEEVEEAEAVEEGERKTSKRIVNKNEHFHSPFNYLEIFQSKTEETNKQTNTKIPAWIDSWWVFQ